MKTCPICNAVAFDDQTTCFGCLHDFAKDELPGEEAFSRADPQVAPASASFLLSIVPQQGEGGGLSWACTVEPLHA